MKYSIDELLQKPYWIIDILPEQVPEDSPGQFFEIERFFLEKNRLDLIKQKHVNVILKINCYYEVSVDGMTNPAPEQIAEAVKNHSLNIMVEEAMIVSEPDDTHMTLFNPDERLLKMIKNISEGEGLFVWQSER